MPFGIPSQKWGVHREMFLTFFVLVFVLGGDFIFYWLELVELLRLYLGASLCILSFSSCHIVFVGLYMLGGVYFCGSCFKLLIDL